MSQVHFYNRKAKYWFWTAARAALESVQPANNLRTDLLFHQHESHCSLLIQSLYMTLIYKQIRWIMAIESTIVDLIWCPLVSQNVLRLLCFFRNRPAQYWCHSETRRNTKNRFQSRHPAPQPKRCIPVKVNRYSNTNIWHYLAVGNQWGIMFVIAALVTPSGCLGHLHGWGSG